MPNNESGRADEGSTPFPLDPTLRRLIDASPIAMIAVDAAARVVRWNDSAEVLLGWPSADVVGSEPPGLPASVADALHLVPSTSASAGPSSEPPPAARVTTEWPDRTGVAQPVTVAVTPIGNGDGALLQLVGAERLFEEADRARREALHARDQAAALVALTADLSAALTPAEVARAAMERGLPAVGATSGSLMLLDEPARELVMVATHGYPAMSSGALLRIPLDGDYPLPEAIRTRRTVFLESADIWRSRYPLLDDALRDADVEALALVPLQVHGRIIGGMRLGFPDRRAFDPADAAYIHALADKCAQAIERSRLFEAERNARLTLDTVIAEMPIGIVVAEPPEGRVVLANAQVDRIWRQSTRPPREIADYGSERVGYRSDGRRLEPREWPLARSIESGEIVEAEEIDIERGDGSRGTILISSAPVRDATGEVIAAVATLSDISGRREAELLRDAFLSVLSHELRTPITSIYGGVQLLRRSRDRVDDATRVEVIEDVAAETERLTRLIEDLLVIARAERGMAVSSADPVLLGHLVRRVVAAEGPRWPQTHFVVDVPPHLPTVRGDEGHLEQVLRNLLSNAAKYGPLDGRVEVVARHAGGEVSLRVLDEGPGIDEAEVNDLFRLFYRSPRTAAATGAGIGLFVTRSLVEAMGGRVWARPRSDRQGAEFGIAIPVFEDVDDV